MWRKTNQCLWILCAIFSQGSGTLSEENNVEGSEGIFVREKRLIDLTEHGNKPMEIYQVPYIVNIQKNNVSNCAGSILDPHIIISAAHCFRKTDATYRVLSGSAYRNAGTPHKIISKIFHPDFNPKYISTDLILLVIYPAIDLRRSHNRKIEIYNGIIPPDSFGIFSGWGCTHIIEGRTKFPNELRSIDVPIISEETCQREYHNYAPITDENICTLDRDGNLASCYGDSGGPLVFRRHLIGVMSWSRGMLSPDVFINVVQSDHSYWILSFIRNMRKYLST